MIRWLKKEGHGIFERMLQVADAVKIGWLVYSTWQMEAGVLAHVIESTINLAVGLRWKQIANGAKDRVPQAQQVKALHVEVASENRLVAQKALLAIYGRKHTGQYPNGIRLRFSLLIHAAHNLNAKAKLERLRARQQLWLTRYEKGFSWEITQLDHPIGRNLPTLRQALLALLSKSDPKFPIFHSVDRSNYKESGICFQFIPELADEARMTISNLVPLMKHKFGASVLDLFSPAAVERMEGCHWDSSTETVIGQFDDEITFLDEEDPMINYINPTTHSAPSQPPHHNPSLDLPAQGIPPSQSNQTMQHMDDDSVSTLGNNTQHKWVTPPTTNPFLPLTQRPPVQSNSPDDVSTSSILTLTTRLTTMETQYSQISGDVQDIKSMLASLATATNHSNRDEPPTNASSAGQGPSLTGGGS